MNRNVESHFALNPTRIDLSLKSDVSYEEIEKIEPQTEETW